MVDRVANHKYASQANMFRAVELLRELLQLVEHIIVKQEMDLKTYSKRKIFIYYMYIKTQIPHLKLDEK